MQRVSDALLEHFQHVVGHVDQVFVHININCPCKKYFTQHVVEHVDQVFITLPHSVTFAQ